MAPMISAATDVRFAEPGVAAETHTIARRDRRWLLLTEEERVAICALLTCVDIVDLVGGVHGGVVESARMEAVDRAGKIRYFIYHRTRVV